MRISLSEKWFSSSEEALEKAEDWEHKFLHRAQEELNSLTRLGRHCPFAFNSSSSYLIQGASFVEPNDPSAIREAKARRARLAEYTQVLQRLLPMEFEMLCAGILELLGVQEPMLTPRSGDEGIDFFGRLRLDIHLAPNPAFRNVASQMSIWLIGQAKHYSRSRVATPDLRDLVGAIELARSGTHVKSQPQLGDSSLRLCDPVFYLFFTTGRISVDAWKLVEKSGIVGMDGDMIASFLADNEIGVENAEFDEGRFRTWILRHA